MQSHHDSFGPEASKRYGHRRTASMGKAMPVTALLMECPPPTRSSLHRTPEQERPSPLFSSVGARNTSPVEDDLLSADDEDEVNIEQEYELLVSDCSSIDNDADDQAPRDNDEAEISLIGNSIFYTPCLTCTSNAPLDLGTRASAINEMCRRLCTDECRLRLSLAGFEPPSTQALQSQQALVEYVKETLSRPPLQHTCSEDTLKEQPLKEPEVSENVNQVLSGAPTRPPSRIAIQRKQFLTDLLQENGNADSDSDSSLEEAESVPPPQLLELLTHLVVPSSAAEVPSSRRKSSDRVSIDPHELALLKDFREKFEIAEALAKTSAMTSTSHMKQRLAARKLEIDNANVKAEREGGDAYVQQRQGAVATANRAAAGHDASTKTNHNEDADNNDDDHDDDDKNDIDSGKVAAVTFVADTLATTAASDRFNEFEPPRELLLYLVRMGSFNSAPKINNVDSQDDSLEIPKGLNNNELLQHVRQLRGEHQPPLLTRYFAKPTLASQIVANDITDGLRSLKLNTVPRDYTVASQSPNHIRVLQWNILSQTLGQNNDGFVRCPEEALTWENRKFLIVQEILQNNPDIVCLQEVDHFKFLQNILGTQNYEGFFFPKPDSPCLYIEENNGPDGCAIFFKRDKFELKNYDTRILEVWRVQSNQVAIAVNLAVKATGQEFCVCTTHLKARHGSLLSKLRNEQGRDLLRFVKQFANDRPVLLCGDFNAEPTEPVYSTILNCDMLKFASAYAEIKAERDECNNDHHDENGNDENTPENNNNGEAADAEQEEDIAKDKAQSSIEREPPYTTWKIREDGEECHTIDYVFYSEEEFKVKNCLEFPHEDEIGKNRTPSFQYPSDHFSLVCDFELLNNKRE